MKEFIEKVAVMLKSAGLNHKYLEDVFKDSKDRKAELNELLGLNEDNLYRHKIAVDMTDGDFEALYPFVSQVFRKIPGWTGEFRPTTGKITVGKDQVNITKFLAKALAEGTIPGNYKEHLMVKLGIALDNPKAELQIVPKLGELLTKKASNVVVVSTNPFDFFTSSAGDFKYASFKSCYRPGGEYFNGCNSLSRDNFSTISYKADTARIDYKQGRAWMFILEDIIAQTKSYGTFTSNERNIARNYAMSRLCEKHNIAPEEYGHHVVAKWKHKANSMVLYFDDYSIDLNYPKKKHPKGMLDSHVPKISFSNAKCLKCGRETQYPTQGICGKCSGNYSECNECHADLYGGREIIVNGRRFCKDCAADKFDLCGHCGNYHEKGTATDVNGTPICRNCMQRYFFWCDHCQSYHNTDDRKKYSMHDATTWCSTCYNRDGYKCPDCGKYHATAESTEVVMPDGGKRKVCATCVKAYAVCACCGLMHKNGTATIDGIVCSTCFPLYDFCAHCSQYVKHDTLMYNGVSYGCKSCLDKKAKAEASHDAYVAEVERIMAEMALAETHKLGDAVARLKQMADDRAANGFVEGDFLRVTADTSYHQYKVGALLVNCKKYIGDSGQVAYCTFRDKLEWFVKDTDVEFARPALVPGEVFVRGTQEYTLKEIIVNADDSIVFVDTVNNQHLAEQCKPVDIIDPKALTQISYKVGEVVEITDNVSRHPFKQGDKVKILHVTLRHGIYRYAVKKGAKQGYIWGSIVDINKPAKVDKVKVPKAVKA